MTETKEIGDIDDIISGFTSGPAGQDCIEKFGRLCEKLELFFEEYTSSLNEEEAGEVETKVSEYCFLRLIFSGLSSLCG